MTVVDDEGNINSLTVVRRIIHGMEVVVKLIQEVKIVEVHQVIQLG